MNCNQCKTVTNKKCTCGIYYCSTNCQSVDWKDHKQQMHLSKLSPEIFTELVKFVNVMLSSNTSTMNKPVTNIVYGYHTQTANEFTKHPELIETSTEKPPPEEGYTTTKLKIHDVTMTVSDFVKSCTVGDTIYIDCVLAVILLDAFNRVNTCPITTLNFQFPPTSNQWTSRELHCITTTMCVSDAWRYGAIAIKFACQWVVQDESGNWWGMLSDGSIRFGTLQAWDAHMVKLHLIFKSHLDDIKHLMSSYHYLHLNSKLEIDQKILTTHSSMLQKLAKNNNGPIKPLHLNTHK